MKIIAAQLAGPADAKKVAYIDGRETFLWKSEDEVRQRIKKADAILAYATREHQDASLLIFPEYSLPVSSMSAQLQSFADANGIVTIGGADSIRAAHGKIYNQCPVFLPGHKEPVWIRRRMLSQWELTKVDPWHGRNPVFWWKHAGAQYWFSVHICLDFLSALEEPVHALTAPGFYVVPMCSQEIVTMRNYADTLLRPTAGRACILANAVDDFAIGSSCVMAVTPDGKPLQPAIEVPKTGEYLLTFELDCAQLAPPRKSPTKPISPLPKPWSVARVTQSLTGYDISPENEPASRPSIAVINPEVFQWHGLRMRIAFRSVKNYTDTASRNRDRDFEILAVLGQEDIVISHLATWEYDFDFDLREMGVDEEHQHANDGPQRVSYFEVDSFFKVLGVPVKEEARGIFEGDKPKPTDEDLVAVFALGDNWNTSSVSDDKKRELVANRWILGETRAIPGDISAVMAITLVEGDQGTFDQFEREVIPSIIGRSEVTTVYGGTAKRRHIDYVLRITTDLMGLYPLIEFVHAIASHHRIMVTTTTYVVVHKISSLRLAKAFARSGGRIHYAFNDLLKRLENHTRRDFRELSEEKQKHIVLQFERAARAVGAIHRSHKSADFNLAKAIEQAALALVSENAETFSEAFNRIHGPAERTLDTSLASLGDAFVTYATKANIPPGKTADKLTVGEKIRVLREAVKARHNLPLTENALAALSLTVDVRNAFSHQKADKLPTDNLGYRVGKVCGVLSVLIEAILPSGLTLV